MSPSISDRKNSVIYPNNGQHNSPGLPIRVYRRPLAAYQDWATRTVPKKVGCERKVTTHKSATKK